MPHDSRSEKEDVRMVTEFVRLVVTLGATAAGFLIGRTAPGWFETGGPSADGAVIVGALLGAGIGYVVGGLLGRFTRRSLDNAPDIVARTSGPELFAGAFGLLAGLLVGAVVSVPAIILLPPVLGWPVGALLVIVLASFGASVFSARADDLLATAGLGKRRGRSADLDERPAIGAFVIDSSAAIDGRILDLARAGLVTGEIWTPGFVLDELQGIADSGQKERRRRGRRGLDVLDAMSAIAAVSLRIDERTFPEFPEVDPHALGESMRRVPTSGDTISLLIEKEGSEPGQGAGYLDDGTMVVVEGGAGYVGKKVEVEVMSAMRTSIGRMVFARLET
jgi:uncharacterized protein YacL